METQTHASWKLIIIYHAAVQSAPSIHPTYVVDSASKQAMTVG